MESKSRKWLCLSHLIKTFLYDGSKHDNCDDGYNDENAESFIHNIEPNRDNLVKAYLD